MICRTAPGSSLKTGRSLGNQVHDKEPTLLKKQIETSKHSTHKIASEMSVSHNRGNGCWGNHEIQKR